MNAHFFSQGLGSTRDEKEKEQLECWETRIHQRGELCMGNAQRAGMQVL